MTELTDLGESAMNVVATDRRTRAKLGAKRFWL
jgi:hypothetical protein